MTRITPVKMFRTSDGSNHDTMEKAEIHEQRLMMTRKLESIEKGALPPIGHYWIEVISRHYICTPRDGGAL